MVWSSEGVSEEVVYALQLLWRRAGRRAPGRGGLLRPPDSLDRAIDIGGLGGFDRAIDNDVFVRGYADPYCGGLSCVRSCWSNLFGLALSLALTLASFALAAFRGRGMIGWYPALGAS